MKAERNAIRARSGFAFGLAVCAALVACCMARGAAAQDQPPAVAADETPAVADETAATPTEPKPETSFLRWVVEASGLIGAVILLLSLYFVHTVSRLFWTLRVETAAPPDLVAQCDALLEQRDFKGVYHLVKDDASFYGRLLATGIRELPNGLAEARDAMERTGDAITAEMEKRISMLAVLGTLGPMIGLLGTLQGMISSFSVIARSDVQLKASEVAAGISQALVLTFEGVGLSVPAIYFFALFRNRVVHISTTVMLRADEFLRHFFHAGRSKGAAAGPAIAPPKPGTGKE